MDRISIALAASCLCLSSAFAYNKTIEGERSNVIGIVRGIRERESKGPPDSFREMQGRAFACLNVCKAVSRDHPAICGESVASFARRGVAYITMWAKAQYDLPDDASGKVTEEDVLNQLRTFYENIVRYEPRNPTWLYQLATLHAARGHYYLASQYATLCIKASGNNALLKSKSQALLSHVQVWGREDKKEQDAIMAYAAHQLLSGQFAQMWGEGGNHSSSYTPQSQQQTSIPDWERKARDAEYRGDYGTASRFRSGGSTIQDNSRYW